jgi:hypothetical protein
VSSEEGIEALEDAFQRTPRCAVHADREARRTPCERCGNYACEPCFERDDEVLCAACRERVGETVAWEREDALMGPLSRLSETVKQLLPAPYTSFERLGEGRGVWSAVLFASFVNLVSYGLPVLVCSPCTLLALMALPSQPGAASQGFMIGAACGFSIGFPLGAAVFAVIGAAINACLYHLAAVVAGGTASFGASFRACLFLHATAPLAATVWILGRIPILGLFLSLTWYVGALVWQTFALAGHAKGIHRIDAQRAWLVASVPALALVASFVLMLFLFMGLVFALLGNDPSFLEDLD